MDLFELILQPLAQLDDAGQVDFVEGRRAGGGVLCFDEAVGDRLRRRRVMRTRSSRSARGRGPAGTAGLAAGAAGWAEIDDEAAMTSALVNAAVLARGLDGGGG